MRRLNQLHSNKKKTSESNKEQSQIEVQTEHHSEQRHLIDGFTVKEYIDKTIKDLKRNITTEVVTGEQAEKLFETVKSISLRFNNQKILKIPLIIESSPEGFIVNCPLLETPEKGKDLEDIKKGLLSYFRQLAKNKELNQFENQFDILEIELPKT